jgi:hypothetical protein
LRDVFHTEGIGWVLEAPPLRPINPAFLLGCIEQTESFALMVEVPGHQAIRDLSRLGGISPEVAAPI